eukprot:TRINITY_DN26756_c0_g1_i1.p1 TRINITY_DN26756_c0_g1~~TRINITY_DN26756_c0_g1_i1.p1  ORF type:complete len:725 (-),score=79.04 TRINITY_DN26756_c0_g1_i1:472-2646(-)
MTGRASRESTGGLSVDPRRSQSYGIRWFRQITCCLIFSGAMIGIMCIHSTERAKILESRRHLATEKSRVSQGDSDVTLADVFVESPEVVVVSDSADFAKTVESACEPGKKWNKDTKKCEGSFGTAPALSWIWWPFGLYLFWAQAEVCDKFFVPSVQVCSDTFRIPEDVAGATLMALGCNGPELAVNVIAIFITKSPVGVGTIVGSDVFNLLVIAGASVLAAQDHQRGPVKLDASKVSRDVLFYAISIVLLVFVISDGRVELWQAAMLSLMVPFYGTAVALWSKMEKCCERNRSPLVEPQTPAVLPSRAFDSVPNLDTKRGNESPAHQDAESQLNQHNESLLEKGLFIKVRKGGRRGRFETRLERQIWARRFMHLDSHTGTLQLSPNTPGTVLRSSSAPLLAPSDIDTADPQESHANFALGGATGLIDIPLKDILECHEGEGKRFLIQYSDRRACAKNISQGIDQVLVYSVAQSGGILTTLEFEASCDDEKKHLVDGLESRDAVAHLNPEEIAELRDEHRHAIEALDPSRRTWKQHAYSIVSWLCFPVLLFLEVTVPKCFTPEKKTLWPLTFFMSMVWLAFFSYWICVMADKVNEEFGVPESVLGLTLTAMGTSFPNCVASVIVARKGQCSMAVANALGSNIQNVFLALGFPWLANAILQGGWFAQPTDGIFAGVVSMAGSLFLFVAALVVGCSSISKTVAYIMLIAYVAFFICTVLQGYDIFPS